MGRIVYENDYIVEGPADQRVSPNFKLKELVRTDGRLFIHRELAAALQVLRDLQQASLRIEGYEPPAGVEAGPEGLFVLVSTADPSRLSRLAGQMMSEGYFSRVEPAGGALYLQMPDPEHLPPMKPKTAFECGLKVTAAFETSGDPFQSMVGNFDGAGISFGPIQFNFGTGTLQDLFKRFRGEDPERLRRCFGGAADYDEWMRVVEGSRQRAVAWADARSTGARKTGVAQPWRGYLEAVGQEQKFRDIMLRVAYDRYGKLMLSSVSFLNGLTGIRIENMRCLAALYDLAVQQGSLAKAHEAIRRRVQKESPRDQFTLTRIAVEERAKTAAARWRADCLSRRLTILERSPVAVTLAGQQAQRGNDNLYLVRNSGVNELEKYLSG